MIVLFVFGVLGNWGVLGISSLRISGYGLEFKAFEPEGGVSVVCFFEVRCLLFARSV